MELLDLCPLETWDTLEDEIYERSGLNPAVYNVDGVRINPKPRWPNRLCPEIKANPKGQTFVCATAHMNMANQARQSGQPVLEECDAGMIKLVVPISVNDTFLGAAGGCGLLLDDGEIDAFLINKIVGLDEGKIESLSKGIPILTTQKAEQVSAFIQERIEQIVSDYLARQ